ncbi:hypothetical protein NC651_007595 [Populus alba x Populus x berolinensis]|nr:hypothetical protein NC651_007595 [Populus alba x Populus x berolinensis]
MVCLPSGLSLPFSVSLSLSRSLVSSFVHVLCLVAEKEKKIEGNETKNLIMLFFFEIGKLNFTEGTGLDSLSQTEKII